MTDDELNRCIAEIEGYEFDPRWGQYVQHSYDENGEIDGGFIPPPGAWTDSWFYCGPLIEKYRLTIEEDGSDWCVMKYDMHCVAITIWNKDLKTAICLAVLEINK